MKRVFRQSALALFISGAAGISSAANHPASFGIYSTAIQEDRLFIEDGTLLRCDLFFSSAAGENTVVAPKGSRVSQSVPPFVWQYSGLIPVSDYLKTVAIHSVSSMDKERAWQDVQQTFYDGLRAEGAPEFEAKVAYAGAYAFAPRWPLVDFIDITDPVRDKESRLYRVEYIAASPKGVTIDEYRSLVDDIELNAGEISLQDIRGVIDAADAARADAGNDDGWLKQIWRNEKSDTSKSDAKSTAASAEATASDEGKTGGNNLGMLFASEKKRLAEEKAQAEAMMEEEATAKLQADTIDDMEMAQEPVPEEGEVVAIPDQLEEASPAEVLEQMNNVETEIEVDDVTSESGSVSDQLAEADREVLLDGESASADETAVEVEGEVVDLTLILLEDQPPARLRESEENDPETELEEDWVEMPDGSEVLKF